MELARLLWERAELLLQSKRLDLIVNTCQLSVANGKAASALTETGVKMSGTLPK